MAGARNTEKDIATVEIDGKAHIHYSERWPSMFIGGVICAVAGMVVEGYFVYQSTARQLVRADNTLSFESTVLVWFMTFAIPLALAIVIHRFFFRRSEDQIARIDNFLGVLAIVAILALPILLAKANGIGLGNPFEASASPEGYVSSSYLLAELARLPVVLILAVVAAFGVRMIVKAMQLREEIGRRKAEVEKAVEAREGFEDVYFLEATRPARLDDRREDMQLGFARAMNASVEVKAKHMLAYARGAMSLTSDFVEQIDSQMKRGLSAFPVEIIDLVDAHVPSGFDFDALPASARDLHPADRDDLIDYALWLRKAYSKRNILKQLKQ